MHLSRFAVASRRDHQAGLCHTQTGAIVLLPPALLDQIQAGNLQALPWRQRMTLLRHGFLVADPQQELDAMLADFLRRKQIHGPLRLTVVPGYACNCACPSCFQHSYDKRPRMKPAVLQAIVDFTRQKIAQDHHPEVILWYYGGEPFVHAEVCLSLAQQMSALCQELNVPCSHRVTTNGTRLTTPKGKALARALDYFYVSLSQSREVQQAEVPYQNGSNSFDDVLRGLAFLAELNKQITLRINVSRMQSLNTDSRRLFEALRDCFGGTMYPRIAFEFHLRSPEGAHCIGKTKEAAKHSERGQRLLKRLPALIAQTGWPVGQFRIAPENYLPSYTQGGCEIELCRYLRGDGFFIDPRGDLYMCNIVENSANHRLGTIFDPEAAMQHPVYQLARTRLWSEDPVCRQCCYLPLCMANCPLGVAECAGTVSRSVCRAKHLAQVEGYVWSTVLSEASNVPPPPHADHAKASPNGQNGVSPKPKARRRKVAAAEKSTPRNRR